METNLCSFVWMVMCVFFCPTMKFVYSVVFLMFLMSWYMFSCISVYFLCRHREVVHVSKVLLCCLVFCFWFVIEALRKTDSDVEQLEYWYFHLLCLRPQNKACCEKKKELWWFHFLWNALSPRSTSRADVHSAHQRASCCSRAQILGIWEAKSLMSLGHWSGGAACSGTIILC